MPQPKNTAPENTAPETEQMPDPFTKEEFDSWPQHIQEMVVEADKLEAEYRTVLLKKEANRTLLRAFRDMGQVKSEVVEYFYKTQNRGPRTKKSA